MSGPLGNLAPGDRAIITTDAWFYAPDGRSYRAAWGTIKAIRTDQETLGVKTNARSSNWYIEIGDTTIAGCQIHYAVRAPIAPPTTVQDEAVKDGVVTEYERASHIYNADGAP